MEWAGERLHKLTSIHSFVKLLVEEGIKHSMHGCSMPQHPICVHSRVIAPTIKTSPGMGASL